MKKLLTGNEAVAEGITESGADVVTGYPGTPSTEVVLTLLSQKKKLDMHIEWSVNEKVAFEIAAGAAWAGKRAIVTMKMSGVNVIADSLSSISYSGCNGGLVIFVADDPGVSAGMPEEDSRYYAQSMIVPMLDLASQQECLDYVKIAFDISEKIGGPIFLRSTTDISHVASDVVLGEILIRSRKAYFTRDIAKYTKAGATWCMAQHRDALNRLGAVIEISDNYISESGIRVNETYLVPDSQCGIIYAGAVQGNFQEILKNYNLNLSWLKIGMVHPLPEKRLKDFLAIHDRILVLEELDPLIEKEVIRIAYSTNKEITILGKLNNTLPLIGTYSFRIIKKGIEALLEKKLGADENIDVDLTAANQLIVKRPTSFCIGCPHRGTYYALNKAIKKLKYKKDEVIITGDIGCTILGMNKPFESCWTEVAMGASIGLAQGFKHAGIEKPVIATIGDSTFFHAGIPPLINAVYQKVNLTVIILDNGWTAMTGFEENPGTIPIVSGNTSRVDIEKICRGCGIHELFVIDPYDVENSIKTLMKAIDCLGVSVVIARRECALQAKRRKKNTVKYVVNKEKCTGCRLCLNELACPAMVFSPKNEKSKAYMSINSACTGCGLCESICPVGAIEVVNNGK